MIALYLFLAWVGVALLVFFAAFYFSGDDETSTEPATIKGTLPGGYKVAIAVAFAGLVLGIPAAVLSKANDRLPSGAGAYIVNASPSEADGRTIFRATCASCHAMSAANARGVYGPDLDVVLGTPGSDPKAIAARVESAIKNGGATGKQMPAELLTSADAKLVAEYIGSVAGK